jgi:hypothetical protein
MIGVWGFQCQHCYAVFHLTYGEGDVAILESLVEDGKCLRCGHDLRVMLAPPAGTVVYEEFEANEYWNRINDLGSKAERVWGCEKVRGLLLEHHVVGCDLVESETHRCVVRSLKLESGHVLHFAIGFGEAVIYRITEE